MIVNGLLQSRSKPGHSGVLHAFHFVPVSDHELGREPGDQKCLASHDSVRPNDVRTVFKVAGFFEQPWVVHTRQRNPPLQKQRPVA